MKRAWCAAVLVCAALWLVSPAEAGELFRASTDFSGTQGFRNWYYQDSNGNRMVYNANLWQGNETYLQIFQTYLHPGNAADAVRRWKAPGLGSIRITGTAADADASCGQGAMVAIRKNGSTLWSRAIANGNTAGFAYDLTENVVAGDDIDFVANRGDDNVWDCDSTLMDPGIDFTAGSAPPPPTAPPVYVQYNAWFRGNHGCPDTGWWDWAGWVHSPDDARYDPCTTPYGVPWLRQTSATVYPLIGTYKSTPELYRWHIRLAKSAGVTGFLVSLFPGSDPACGGNEREWRSKFMDMLRVASEENFKIGFEAWVPWETTLGCTLQQYYDNIKAELDQAQASAYASALLRINGLPAYWLRTWEYVTLSQITTNLFNQRSAFWIVTGPQSQSDLNTARASITNNSQLTGTANYNYPTTSGCVFHSNFSIRLNELASNGMVSISHGFPGFNEAASSLGGTIGQPAGRYCLWDNYSLMNGFLNLSRSGGAQIVILESWNDETEWTNLEPAIDVKQYRDLGQETLYNGDPYRTLKQIAAWKGVPFVAPAIDCTIVDSLMVSQLGCAAPPPPPPPEPCWPPNSRRCR